MPISDEQRASRRDHMGGSDVGEILFGADGGYRVWAEKTHKDTAPREETEAMALGNVLEPMLLEWAEDYHDAGPLEVNVQVPHGELLFLNTQVDGLLLRRAEPNDAKVSGLAAHINTSYRMENGIYVGYGEPGTDEVPDKTLAQMTTQIACCRSRYKMDVAQGWLPALIGGRGRLMFRIEWNDGLWQAMAEQLIHFWDYHVQRDIPPEDSTPTWDVVKQFAVRQGTCAHVPVGLITDLHEARRQAADWDKAAKDTQAKIVALAGGAEYILPDTGEGALHVSRTEKIIPGHWQPDKPYKRTAVLEVKSVPKRIELVEIERKEIKDGTKHRGEPEKIGRGTVVPGIGQDGGQDHGAPLGA